MKFLQTNWRVILFALVALTMFFLVFRSCHTTSHKEEKKAVIDTVAIVQARETAFNIERDSLNRKAEKWEKKSDSLSNQLIITKKNASKVAANITHLITIGEAFKTLKDTVELLKNRDSIISETMVQGDVVIDLITQYDSLITAKDSVIDVKDQLLAKQEKLYSDLRISFNTVSKDYQHLYTDYRKAESGRKFNKTLVRIESAAVLILGGLIYFRK